MTHVHLIGIGGSGLSAIAQVLLESGYAVSGSDRAISPLAENLVRLGARVEIGHAASHITGADIVVRSSAIPDSNPEVQAALAQGIPVLKRSEFLGQLLTGRIGIAIAGTHGKTTTTAMIAWMLTALGQDPSFIVGGVLKNGKTNAHAGKGEAFVIEADEYDRMFLGLAPKIMVITNVEHDHPDCYPTLAEYEGVFAEFTTRLQPGGTIIGCIEDGGAAATLHQAELNGQQILTYALGQSADFQARKLERNAMGGFSFTLFRRWSPGNTAPVAQVNLRVPGEHNVLNCLAALATADRLGLPLADAIHALEIFQGTGRRFEIRGEVAGVTVIDDYAHHPSEIRATLAAAHSSYPGRRIWAVWQPHTYSRTRALFMEFATAFRTASQVIVTEVFAAREPVEAFSAADLIGPMDHPSARFIPTLPQVVDFLADALRQEDVLLVLSAGDADQISTQVLERLAKQGLPHA
ncbi:MAG TPA: UDP-N-acetylmuramate--L-alanine ligase [Anaerolineaceae bacterium]|jgi:UDP-N-acetylmuramate--alanine ligase